MTAYAEYEPQYPIIEVADYAARTIDGISIRADGEPNPTAAQLGLGAYTERAISGIDALIWAAEVPL